MPDPGETAQIIRIADVMADGASSGRTLVMMEPADYDRLIEERNKAIEERNELRRRLQEIMRLSSNTPGSTRIT